MALIEDGTYFVHEADEEIVACGGWSRRDRLYAGSREGADAVRLLAPTASPRGCARCSSEATGPAASSAG